MTGVLCFSRVKILKCFCMAENFQPEQPPTPEQEIARFRKEIDNMYKERMLWPPFATERLAEIREIKNDVFGQESSKEYPGKLHEFRERLTARDLMDAALFEYSDQVLEFKRVIEKTDGSGEIRILSPAKGLPVNHENQLIALAADMRGICDSLALLTEAKRRAHAFAAKPAIEGRDKNTKFVYMLGSNIYRCRQNGYTSRRFNKEHLWIEREDVGTAVFRSLPRSVFKDFVGYNKIFDAISSYHLTLVQRVWDEIQDDTERTRVFRGTRDVAAQIAEAYLSYELLAMNQVRFNVSKSHPLSGRGFADLANPFAPFKDILQKGYLIVPGTAQCLVVREIPANLATK